MLVDPRNPRLIWLKLIALIAALVGVIWAMRSINEQAIPVQPPASQSN